MNTSPSQTNLTPAQNRFIEAADGRDFTIYTRSMSAATLSKARQIFPHLRIPEDGRILDVGSGTGDMARLATEQFSRADVYGLDLSHELLEIAEDNQTVFQLVYGDAREKNFPDNYFDGSYCNTTGHEVASFGSKEDLHLMLQRRFSELKPGSFHVHRDFAKPDISGPVYLRFFTDDGTIDTVPEDSSPHEINYSELTVRALFFEFAKRFQGGNSVQFEIIQLDNEEYIKLDATMAYEFISRKDYRANFLNEIKETYSYWTPQEGVLALKKAGFTEVAALPEYHEWIIPKRWQGRIGLFQKDTQNKLVAIPFFPTHVVWVGKKPFGPTQQSQESSVSGIDYSRLSESIHYDELPKIVSIEDKTFRIDTSLHIEGSKREVFGLRDRTDTVLKIPRRSGLNMHNSFKAMLQTLERTEILEEYNVPHARLLEYDTKGPPYRYLVQERLPESAPSAAALITQNELTENDVRQMAEIINEFERKKEWQLDSNPFNWFRVTLPHGSTQMTYADGKVYRYDEQWAFPKVGLVQWLLPELLQQQNGISSAIVPTQQLAEKSEIWWDERNPVVAWWAKYLDEELLPGARRSFE